MTEKTQNRRFFFNGKTWHYHFQAMASPCSVLLEGCTGQAAKQLGLRIEQEAKRIEQKYSRYRDDSALSAINNAQGQPCSIDHETWQLLNLSDVLWQQSEGRFDITSGVLRKLWTFSAPSSTSLLPEQPITPPTQTAIQQIQHYIGWDKTQLTPNSFTLPQGMQIDLGGIGKEYAADQCIAIAHNAGYKHCLVNLGGDIVSTGTRKNGEAWQVGVELAQSDFDISPKSPKQTNNPHIPQVWRTLPLTRGAIATSGDAYRYFMHQGKRYGHILNAQTGYPVEETPRSITVAAPNALEAGMITTLALLQGKHAEAFLKQQQRPYWIQN